MQDDIDKEQSDGFSSEFFRRNWAVYRKIIENNYMGHGEAYSKLRDILLAEMKRPFSFLDLACGDAYYSSRVLIDTNVALYTGIDLSEAALSVAREELDKLDCEKQLRLGDIKESESVVEPPLDIVWVGLSLHHFETGEKAAFMKRVHADLSDDGIFLIYEPVYLEGEDRAAYYERIKRIIEDTWTGLTPEETLFLLEHVKTTELPETRGDWLNLGKQSGFTQAESIFSESSGLYSLFMFRK